RSFLCFGCFGGLAASRGLAVGRLVGFRCSLFRWLGGISLLFFGCLRLALALCRLAPCWLAFFRLGFSCAVRVVSFRLADLIGGGCCVARLWLLLGRGFGLFGLVGLRRDGSGLGVGGVLDGPLCRLRLHGCRFRRSGRRLGCRRGLVSQRFLRLGV